MIYRIKQDFMKQRKIMKKVLLFLFTLLSAAAPAQDIPGKPSPPRLVNDFAGILNSNEINTLESKLVTFNDSTTTQIAIVTVSDLNGYAVSDYAQRLGEKWGVGQKGFDNGIVILIKPGSGSSKGEISIQQGYGLEGAIPDILCGQIIDYEILPSFRNGQYYEGLDKATDALMSLARGDFPASKYKGKKSDLGALLPFAIFIIVLIIVVSAKSGGGKNQKHISDKGLPIWLLLSMMNSGRSSHRGSWGGFSGGGSGGFGGFGGGSFGGGGASGSW
jgi:uncharacterized protein